jgi:hypothetical protein
MYKDLEMDMVVHQHIILHLINPTHKDINQHQTKDRIGVQAEEGAEDKWSEFIQVIKWE